MALDGSLGIDAYLVLGSSMLGVSDSLNLTPKLQQNRSERYINIDTQRGVFDIARDCCPDNPEHFAASCVRCVCKQEG